MRKPTHVAAALAVLTALLYSPSLAHEFVNFDDTIFVTENDVVRSGLSLTGVLWAFTEAPYSCPLAWVSHMLDVSLFGMWAGGHHLTSVLLHSANAAVLFLALMALVRAGAAADGATAGAAAESGAVWPCAAVAALFAWHPLHVESVAWVAERRDVLSGLFGWLSLWAYARFVEQPGWRRHVPVFLFLLLGLLSKAMLITWPFVLLLLDFWPLGRLREALPRRVGGVSWETLATRVLQLVLEKAPLFLLAFFFTLEGMFTAQETGLLPGTESLPLSFRLKTVVTGYAAYLGKTLWPADLTVLYLLPSEWNSGRVFLAVAILAILTGVSCWHWRARPFLIVGWLWFLGTLVPVAGFVQGGSHSIADRYTYVPLVGVFLMIAWGAAAFVRERPGMRIAARVGTILLLVVCACVTALQLRHWRTSATLFRQAIRVDPANALAHNNLGAAEAEAGRMDEAILHYREATMLSPYFPDPRFNLATALALQKRHAEARAQYALALGLQPDTNRVDSAITGFRLGVNEKPSDPEAHHHLANALIAAGRLNDAVEPIRVAVRLKNSEPDVAADAALLSVELGRPAEAVEQLAPVVRAHSGHVAARAHFASALTALRRHEEAIEHAREAARLAPTNALARSTHGLALAAAGRLTEALPELREGLRLDPSDPVTLDRLARGFAMEGASPALDPAQAAALSQRACQWTGRRRAAFLATLASALIANGRIAEAAPVLEETVTVAGAAGQTQLAGELGERLIKLRGANPPGRTGPAPFVPR